MSAFTTRTVQASTHSREYCLCTWRRPSPLSLGSSSSERPHSAGAGAVQQPTIVRRGHARHMPALVLLLYAAWTGKQPAASSDGRDAVNKQWPASHGRMWPAPDRRSKRAHRVTCHSPSSTLYTVHPESFTKKKVATWTGPTWFSDCCKDTAFRVGTARSAQSIDRRAGEGQST